MTGTLVVADRGRRIAFRLDDRMRYHGGGSPGGVAHAFGGPGARGAFELVTRGRRVTLAVREGFMTDELIDLARTDPRSEEQERRLDRLKREMADRVMASPAVDVYDVD